MKLLISRAIGTAKESIYLASFGLTDPDIATLVHNKAALGIKVEVHSDGKEPLHIDKLPNIAFNTYFGKGIMHRKVIGIDHDLLLLGSTNLTLFSLEIHRNLVLSLRSKELFAAIVKNTPLATDTLSFYPLPHFGPQALAHFLKEIHQAKKRIFAAIYTFTHPEILDAFIRAKERGVDVRVYLDRTMARGASKSVAHKLLTHNIPVRTNLRDGLLHYKCALIDDTFLFGSANWTKAAFEKNQEYLILFHSGINLDTLLKFFHSIDRSCLPHL